MSCASLCKQSRTFPESKPSNMKRYRHLQEAKELMYHIDYEEEVRALKKRWLTRRWPEDLHCSLTPLGLRECGFLAERCIPESFLRDDNSARDIKTNIRRIFDAFDEKYNDNHHSQHFQSEKFDLQPEKLQCLSDQELFGSLPVLLKFFKLNSLHALVTVVTGRPYHGSRKKLIRKIQQELSILFAQAGEETSNLLQKIQHFLRDPNNISQSFPAQVLTEMLSSPLSAAKSTLEQLEKLPVQTLQAMRRKMCRMPLVINSRPMSGSRKSMAKQVKKRAERLLWHVRDGDSLPEPLNSAMLVASLSARQICGQDGGLLQSLGPVSPETEALQNDFLRAISYSQNLKWPEVKDVYNCLFSDNEFSSKHLRILRNKIQTILIDWLFESNDATIPEPIMRSVTMINKLHAGKMEGHKIEERVEAEFECVLNVSSHLQEIIQGWTEYAGFDQGLDEASLDTFHEDVEPWFSGNSSSSHGLCGDEAACVGVSTWEPEVTESCCESGPRENQGNDLECSDIKDLLMGHYSDISCKDHIKLVETNSCHTNMNERRENLQEQIQRICDEASLFAHHLLGCMMDESLSRQGDVLETTTKTYLRNGVPADESGKREHCNYQDITNTSVILNVALKLMPQMAGSVIENVKLSVGVT